MATKKKESEGIALLSMYNDEEDEEIEDVSEERVLEEEEDSENFDNRVNLDSSTKETTTSPSLLQSQYSISIEDSTFKEDRVSTLTPQLDVSVSSPPQPTQLLQTTTTTTTTTFERRGLTIVDYGHDETAMSPEAEEGEIMGTGRFRFGEDIQTANGKVQGITPPGSVQILTPNIQGTPHPSEQSEYSQSDISSRMDYVKMDSETTVIEETVMVPVELQKELDPLDDFLPPPPKTMCSKELQEKINKFLMLKKAGKSFNAEVRNRKDYRNPDFLVHAVKYQDIDQIGSCFSKDVFDPHGYDKSDYYDEIENDLKREIERKELERKRNPKVEFVTGATQLGGLAATQNNSSQLPVAPTVASTGFHPHPTPIERESRQNKKSKWDKDDGDRKNSTSHIGSRDAQSSAATRPTLLSAANAGSGYTALPQQKRREAEARKSSEKRRS